MASFVASSGGGANVAMIWLCIYVRTTDARWSLFLNNVNSGPIGPIDRINFGVFEVFSAELSSLILALSQYEAGSKEFEK